MPRSSTVVLVGMRGAGKTTVGRALAQRLGLPFVDSDERLAELVGMPVGRWLEMVGETAFRVAEAKLVGELLAGPASGVVATGGGAVTTPSVRAALQAPGLVVVWLHAEPGTLLARQRAASIERPALTRLAPAAEVEFLARVRDPLYAEVARIRVDTTSQTPATSVDEVARRLGW